MWFILPRLAGLARREMSRRYAIRDRDEARAYLEHPVLGARLRECAEAVLAVEGKSAREIMGSPDDLKLRSCATLFARVSPGRSVYERMLEKYYDGEEDPGTVGLLG